MRSKKRAMLAVLLTLATCGYTTAKPLNVLALSRKLNHATVAQSQNEINRQLTAALSALENCQNSGKLKDEKITAFSDLVKDLRDLVEIEKARITELKAANADRASASKIDDERILNYERLIKSYEGTVSRLEAEVLRLRGERDALRKSRIRWGVAGVILGALAALVGAR